MKKRTAVLLSICIFTVGVLLICIIGSVAPHGRITPVAPQNQSTWVTPSTQAKPSAAPKKIAATIKPISEEQRNATLKAVEYLDDQSFSRTGLIKQLEFEGYSKAASTAAVNSIHIDWNVEAAAKAKEYLDDQAFSRKGLIGQLEFDGFTSTQATYGANKTGL